MTTHTGRPTETPHDPMSIARLASSGCFPRALAVAARLRVADALDGTFKPVEEIAARTGSDPDVLGLMLQVLALCGVFERDEDGRYGLSEKFAALRSDHPQSLRNFCILLAETYVDAFGALLHTVRTGDSGFHQVFGAPLYDHLERDSETGPLFDRAMAELAAPAAAAILKWYDFSAVRRVVDIGGGNGALLTALTAGHPHLEGVCVDRPSVCERAEVRAEARTDVRAGVRPDAGAGTPADPRSGVRTVRSDARAGVGTDARAGEPAGVRTDGRSDIGTEASGDRPAGGRVRFHSADIFQEVPAGGDLYILKNVLHDWGPDQRLRLLGTVREAMVRTAEAREPGRPRPRLLVVEPLVETDADAVHGLFQMVVCGKHTRGFEADDMSRLLVGAGFEPLSRERLPTGHHVFECGVQPR